MSRPGQVMQSSRWLGAAVAGLMIVACGDGSDPTTSEPTVSAEVTTTDASGSVASTTTTDPDVEDAAGGVVVCDGCEPIEVGPDWVLQDRAHFVHDMAPGSVLEARSAPDFDAAVVAEIAGDATGIMVYGSAENGWVPIMIGDGAGWLLEAFLRPEAAVEEPLVVGEAPPEVALLAQEIVGAGFDGPTLATVAGPLGLRLSLDGAVTLDDPTVPVESLADPTSQAIDWGFTPEGESVFLTLDERLHDIAGSPAITSTEEIGYDETLEVGDPVGNLDDAFPDAHVVEYHFAGTESADGQDWYSVRLVIDVSNDTAVLVAIVEDRGPG